MNSLWTCFIKCKLQPIKINIWLPTRNINSFLITWAPCYYTLRMMINYVVTLYCVRVGNVWGMEIYFYCLCCCVNAITLMTLERNCSKLNSNVISITYVNAKSLQHLLSSYCMTFAYVCNKCSTIILLVSNYMVLLLVCLNHILSNVD
jgi:hypothetical protein